MITGKILKRNGWPEGRIIGLAKNAAEQLETNGLEQDAILAQLDRVRAQPGDFLSDAVLGNLAREISAGSRHRKRSMRLKSCVTRRWSIASGDASTSMMARWRRWMPPCACRSAWRAR